MNSTSYNYLIQRLDAFIRKYYLNQVVKGSLYVVAIIGSMYLLFSILEYYLYLSQGFRKVLFYGFLISASTMLGFWVLQPLFRYWRLGKVMDHGTASKIIGAHFSEVEDKLLNILQLKSQADGLTDRSLIEASIDQKIKAIQPVPFQMAVDLRKNKKYLPYAIPPLAVFIFLLFAAPNILVDSNYRLLNNNQYFEKQAPFQFVVETNPLEVVQYDDFMLEVRLKGNALPANVSIETPAGVFQMERIRPDRFQFQFNTVANDLSFVFTANGFRSEKHQLSVIPKPVVQQFKVHIDYPNYTGRKDETLENTGDLSLPEGSVVQWEFETAFTEAVQLQFEDSSVSAIRDHKNQFTFEQRIFKGGAYSIGTSNAFMKSKDTMSYFMQVIPDAYPQVQVEQITDSTDIKYVYFIGEAGDDYGLTKGGFGYKLERLDEEEKYRIVDEGKEKVLLSNAGSKAGFTYAFNMNRFGLQAGDKLTYYFEVWDNDGVHGPKSARTAAMQFIVPTVEELKEIRDDGNAEVEKNLEKILDELKDIREKTEDLEEKFLQKKELNWEDKKKVEDLLNKQQQLQKELEELQKDFKENLSMEQEYLQPDEKILEKQLQLEELFNEVMSEEMKELYKELQELLEQLNKEQSLEEMQEMDMNNEQLEQELDRMLELFKQLQVEQKMQEAIDDLEQLAEEQKELSEETNDKNSDVKDQIDQQEEINKSFEELQQDLEELEKMNEELADPKDMENSEQQQNEIQEQLKESMEQLQQNKKKQAAQSQQKAGEKMDDLAKQMKEQMQQAQMEQQQEDMRALSQLLDNLIQLSVSQEDLIYELQATKTTDPRYVALMNEQQRIKDDTRMVEDSLIALSKRVTQISSFITREMGEVNRNLSGSLDALHERSTNQANMFQQFSMTGYNNLALMLDEVMQQMQEQMAQSMPGSQMCQKPGGESQLPSMSEMQKQLNEQLQKMKGQMSEGPKPGQRQGMSQQLAEMAQQQAALREALQKMAEELGGGNTEDGKLAKQLQQIADQMDQTEEDIVNKRLTEETLRRQEEILTRLLEATESERERKMDDERKSNTAEELYRDIPPALEEYLRKRNAELDLYKTVAPELKPFYKNLVEEYFRTISFQ
jgi:hypothetical protein